MKKLWIENIENPARVWDNDAPNENFTDMSNDMVAWDKSTHIMDWSRRRDEISPLFYTIASANLSTYSALTYDQKIIGAIYFLVPYALRVSNGLFSDADDKINWLFLLTETKKSRISCVEAMRLYAGDYIRTGQLTLVETQKFFNDVYPLLSLFTEANLPDFKQWLTNEVGSVYESDGFEEKTYYSLGLKTGLLDIYNGNY